MPLSSGDKLGPYQIVAAIGAGGMGEVYRAQDSRLNRDVAIKVSGEQFSERFENEAKAIAALNHPNICQIYDVGPNFLVMEYIEGRPILDCERPQALAPDEALRIARQILTMPWPAAAWLLIIIPRFAMRSRTIVRAWETRTRRSLCLIRLIKTVSTI